MGNEQSKEPSDRSDTEQTGPWSPGKEEQPICKIEPNHAPIVQKISSRKRKWVDDDVICISDDDDVIAVNDTCELISDITIQPEVQPDVQSEFEPEVKPEVAEVILVDNTEKDDSNTDSDASPIKHHRTDSRVESMEVDEVKKSLFPIDPKYECSVSIYNCNADDIQELQVS